MRIPTARLVLLLALFSLTACSARRCGSGPSEAPSGASEADEVTWVGPRLPADLEQPTHSTIVLAVGQDGGVVVINLGAEDGVKEGFQYVISRGDRYVTTIKINDVQAKQSAGFSMRDLEQDVPQKGDRALSGR